MSPNHHPNVLTEKIEASWFLGAAVTRELTRVSLRPVYSATLNRQFKLNLEKQERQQNNIQENEVRK